jgi:hypothetical protein
VAVAKCVRCRGQRGGVMTGRVRDPDQDPNPRVALSRQVCWLPSVKSSTEVQRGHGMDLYCARPLTTIEPCSRAMARFAWASTN